jgi:hypothetical protein
MPICTDTFHPELIDDATILDTPTVDAEAAIVRLAGALKDPPCQR